MKVLAVLVVFVVLAGPFSCSDKNVNQPPTNLIAVSGTVWACNCISWCLNSHPYSILTGKSAKVVLTRDDGLSFTAITDDSSRFWVQVDTGTYQIFTETYYQPLQLVGQTRITSDRSDLSVASALTYDPPDSLQAQFLYGPTDRVWSEAQERRSLDYQNSQLGGVLGFNNIQRQTVSYHDTTFVTYDHLGVRAPEPGWKAESDSKLVVENSPNRFPPLFRLYGYFHICQMGN